MVDPGDVTLAAYQAAADLYLRQSSRPGPAVLSFLDRFKDLVHVGHVLELGSGPGWDAAYLEGLGLRVSRTDATPAFIDRLRADGHDARLLDIRRDPLGGPYDAVLANAVFLHLGSSEIVEVLHRVRDAVVDTGVLAFTLKEGDGSGWSKDKLNMPRHFSYWREPALRETLGNTGWTVIAVDHVVGRKEPWLFVLARPRPEQGQPSKRSAIAN